MVWTGFFDNSDSRYSENNSSGYLTFGEVRGLCVDNRYNSVTQDKLLSDDLDGTLSQYPLLGMFMLVKWVSIIM